MLSQTHAVLVSPFLTDDPLHHAARTTSVFYDVILVSHAAVDHYGDASGGREADAARP